MCAESQKTYIRYLGGKKFSRNKSGKTVKGLIWYSDKDEFYPAGTGERIKS